MKKLSALLLSLLLLLTACGTPATPGDAVTLPTPNDEILAEEPFNRDAMTGKNLIARQKAVENRLEHLAERARPAIPEPRPDADPEEPGKAEESAPVREPRFKLLRSKKVRAVLIALFAVVFLVAIYCTCGYGYFR